jgi:hypothetical protein
MSDLKERLRANAVLTEHDHDKDVLREAADRIAQLEAFARRVADLFDGKALGAEARAELAAPSGAMEERT